jgi:regulatory protein
MLSRIRSSALGLLARREHSKFELQQNLSKKGFVSQEVAKIIHELASQGLQSEDRFIEGYVTMRSRRGFGPVRIKAELQERGIDKEQIEQFITENDPVWFELVKSVRHKKFGKNIPRDLCEMMRQKKYLYYKGFTGDHIKRIFKYEEDL